MTRREYEVVKSTLEMVHYNLARPGLSEADRTNYRQVAEALTRHLMSPWIPFEWGRRVWMLLWILAGIGGAALRGHPLFLLGWLLAATCSPRIVGRLTQSIHHVWRSSS